MNQTGTININSQPNSNNNKPADHRGSDASDASTGHLMVYEDLSARRSSISFDKIRQISLSYSLQSEDAGDTDTVLERPGAGSGVVDIGAGGDGQQDAARRCVVQNSSVPVLLPNGCSDIIMTNNDEPAARTTTNGRGQDRIERPAGSVVEAQAAPKDAPHSDAPRAMDVDRLIGTSNSKNGLPAAAAETGAATNSLGAGLEACRQHRNQSAGAGDASTDQAAGGAARRNPFVVYSDDEALVQDKQVACALPKQEAKFSPAAKLEANRLNQSRSPTRSQQYKTSSSTSNNNNNNSTISLKLAKNMGANIIIDSDKHIALIQGSDRRRSSYEPTDINQEDLDQFSSDNSSSCWDCASGPTTTQRRVVVGGGQGHEEARPNLPAGPMTPSGRRRRQQQQQQQTRSDLLETDYRRAASLTPEVDSANTIRNGNGDGGTTNSSNNNLNNRLDQLQLALDNRQHYQEALVSKGPGRLTSARPASKQPNPRDPNARASPSRAPGPPETVLAGSQLMSRRPVGGAGQKHRGAAYSTTSDHQHHRHQTRTTNGQIYARDDEVDYDYDEDDVDEGDDNDEEEEEDRLASDNSRPFFDNADYEQLAGADEMLVVTSDRSDRSDARVGLIPPVVGGRQCAGDEGGERPNGHNGGAHQDRFLNCSPGRTARQPLRAATMPQMETGVGSTASADRLKRELRTPVRPKLPSPLLQQERRAREPMRTYAPPDATSRGGRELRARPEELADDYLTATAAVSKDLKGQSQPQQQPRRRRQRMMEDQPFYDGQHQQHWTPARRDATEAASSGGSGGRYSEMAAIAQARASSLGRGTPMTGAARHFDYVGRQRDNDDDDDPAGGDRVGGAGAADGPPVGFDDDIDWALATTPRRWRPQWRDHRGSSGDRGTAAVWGATRVVDESSQHRQGTPADERGARRKHGELAGGSSWRPGASPQRAPMGRHQFAPAECGVCQQPLVAAARKSGSGDNLRIRPSPTHRGGRRPMNQPTTALTTNEKEAATRTALVLDNDDDEGEDEEEDRLELELDETKQISIIIGTPKRRHSSRQKRYQNSGSSTASTMTPPPLVRRQDDFYYYDDYHHRPADFVDVGQAWPHWATSGASAAAGQQQWRRRRPSFDYPARPEQDDNNMNQEQRQQRSRQRRLAAAAGGGRTTYAFGGNDYESTTSIATNTAARRGRRHEARWPPLGASDNFELVQSAGLVGDGSGAAGWGLQNSEATTSAADSIETSTIGGVGVSVGSRMKQKPRELSRRSTISSSSEGGGCLAVATDSQEDAQRVQSGAQFQRRPTGPFEVGHHPAGGQQQQPMMTLAKMRLQQPQQQQPQLLQQANQQKQQQPYDDHCDSRTVAEGHGKAADSTSSVTPSGVASLPPPPPPASEQINLDARTANKMHHPPAAATAAPTTATAAATAATSPEKPAPKPPVPAQDQKPIKLRNLLTKEVTVDSLHLKNTNRPVGCRETSCLGSIIDPVPVEHRVRTPDETRAQAKEFIDGYYASIKRFDTPAHKNRLLEIEEQINTTDTYYLRETELIYGAKLAWRNAPRCIGRIQWSKLQVFDARCTRTADEMFEAICNHIKYATNKGNLRSAITIFPQRVKSTQNDWRVWNPQLIGYAGYKDKETGKVIGDPLNVDLTEICQKLGWQGKGGQFDILPLVLQANGGPPKLFKLPEELVLRVKLRHPKLDWFQELGLEWYAVPAVSNMMLDLGGLQFTACPFNGWYMVTEVGARDLGDTNRYNVLEPIAQRMGLNTTTNMSLWRDQALTQLNLAVLYSYQQSGVTIVDHHTACETFMTHLKNEQRLRGGCPADWVWLVPPTAGSTTQVFHQEMVNYHLMPNYEYLQPAWKNFDWIKWERAREESRASKAALISAGASGGVGGVGGAGTMGSPASKLSLMSTIKAGGAAGGVGAGMSPLSKLRLGMNQSASGALVGSAAAGGSSSPASSAASPSSQIELTPRHLRFKEIARAVKFTSKLFGKALSRRIKATILYATETGKSERFANKLAQTFSHAFNVHLMSMSDYDMTCLEHEALLLIVTSTFGNGDPPENGELFAKHLAAIKMTGDSSPDIDSINSVSTNPFFQMLSEDHKDGLSQAASGGASGSSGTGDGPLGGDSLQAPGGSGDNSLTSGANRGHDDSDDTASSSSSSSGSNPSLSSISKRRQDGDDDGDCGLAVSPPAIQTLPPTSPPSTAATTTITTTTTTTNGTDRKQRASTLVRQADSISCQQLNQEQQTNIRPLSNVRFAVFALGSTAYPHFCAFGRYVDQTLGELGAERILKCCCGDELSGQEKALTEWSQEVFKVACDVFCLTDTMEPIDDRPEALWTPQDVRFEYVEEGDEVGLATPTAAGSGGVVVSTPPSSSSSKSSIIQNLAGIVGKKILPFSVRQRLDLHEFIPEEGLQTIRVDLDSGLKPVKFQPGDHIGIYPVNKFEVVDKILKRIEQDLKLAEAAAAATSAAAHQAPTPRLVHNMDKKVSILLKRGKMDPLTQGDDWIRFDTLPLVSIREALTRYLDITNAPNQDFLSILARQTNDPEDKKRLQQMARNFTIYEEWKNKQAPSLLSTLEEFKSVCFDPALITQIPPMKPRFYSVSGTSITLTLGVVRYKTSSGEPREGLCSNYLNTVPADPRSYVFGYVRSAPAFHMPQDKSVPMLLISAGTGIAPFRSFWQQRYSDMNQALTGQQQQSEASQQFGRIEFYFGCRNSRYILYKDDLDDMHNKGVLSSINIAFSRPLDRDVIEQVSDEPGAKATDVLSSPPPQQQPHKSSSRTDSIKQARKRMYVQDKLLENHKLVFKSIVHDGAHIYVCGDVAMADGVYKTLAKVININLKANNKLARQTTSGHDHKSPNSGALTTATGGSTCTVNKGVKIGSVDLVRSGEDGESVLMNLRNLNRYHEDIFGAKQV